MKLTEKKIGILVLASPLQGRRYMCGFLGNGHLSQFFVAVFLLAGLFVTVTHSLAKETEADSENPFIYSLTERQNKFLAGAQLGCFHDEALGKSYFIEIARGDLADGVFTLRTIKARRLRGELRNKTKSLASAPSKRLRREVALLREQITLWQNCRTWAGPKSGAPSDGGAPPVPDGPGATPGPTPGSTPEESPSPAPTTTLAPTPLPTVSPTLVPSPTLSPSPSATPTPVATPTATPTPTVAPSPSPTATPVQTATSLTHGAVTWTFSSARPVGQYVDGSYWVLAPVTITSITPAFNGMSNGSMLNPRPIPAANGVVYSGYDTRDNYDSNLRVQTPVSYSNNGQIRSLVSTIGNSNPSAALDPYGLVSGSYIREMRVLTIVPSVPAQDAFRPNYLGLTKFQFRLGDMNLEVFNLGLDANRYAGQIPSAAMVNQMLSGGTWAIMSGNWGDRYLRPSQSSPGYGQYFARMIGDLALYMLHFELPHREAVIRKLLQYGIDVAGGVAESSTLFSRDGGQTNGHKLPLYLLAHALHPGEAKNLIALVLATHPFSENGQIVGGTPFYTPNSGFSFAGFSSTGAVEQQHPSTYTSGMFHAQRYKYCCTLTIFGGPWLVVSLLDGWDLWGSHPFRHYVWGYFELENLNAQASIIDQQIAIYNSTRPPEQHLLPMGNWFVHPETNHGTHYSVFAEQVWSHEADLYYP